MALIAHQVAKSIIDARHAEARAQVRLSALRTRPVATRRRARSWLVLATATALLVVVLLAMLPAMAAVPAANSAPGPSPAPAPSHVVDVRLADG